MSCYFQHFVQGPKNFVTCWHVWDANCNRYNINNLPLYKWNKRIIFGIFCVTYMWNHMLCRHNIMMSFWQISFSWFPEPDMFYVLKTLQRAGTSGIQILMFNWINTITDSLSIEIPVEQMNSYCISFVTYMYAENF